MYDDQLFVVEDEEQAKQPGGVLGMLGHGGDRVGQPGALRQSLACVLLLQRQEQAGRVAVIGRHKHAGDAVVPDNEKGGYLLGAELYALGHHRFGVVAGPKHLTTTTDRFTGLHRAAREHGWRLLTRRIVYADFDRAGGAAAASELLDAEPKLTAIVALNDSMAVGVLAMLPSRGIRVPDQMSVVGFDDMQIASDVTPALTTVRLPLADMGAWAMTLALRPSGEGEGPRIEQIDAELIRRDSVGPPRP